MNGSESVVHVQSCFLLIRKDEVCFTCKVVFLLIRSIVVVFTLLLVFTVS